MLCDYFAQRLADPNHRQHADQRPSARRVSGPAFEPLRPFLTDRQARVIARPGLYYVSQAAEAVAIIAGAFCCASTLVSGIITLLLLYGYIQPGTQYGDNIILSAAVLAFASVPFFAIAGVALFIRNITR